MTIVLGWKLTCRLSDEFELGLELSIILGIGFAFSSFFPLSFSFILSETFLSPSLLFARNPEGFDGREGAAVSLADRSLVTRDAVADGTVVGAVALEGGRLVGGGAGAMLNDCRVDDE